MRESTTRIYSVVTALTLALAPVTANARIAEPAAEEADAPIEGPQPSAEPSPVQPQESGPSRGPTLRKVGTGLIASGGVIAAVGLSLTIAYTILGDLREQADDPDLAEIEQINRISQVGGISLASGLALLTVGGVIYTRGKTRSEPRPVADIRLRPTLRGVIVSGRF